VTTKPAGRVQWLDHVAYCVRKKLCDLTAGDLVLAHAFTSGNFDYRSGRQTNPVAHSFLAAEAGMTSSSATRFFRKVKAASLVEEFDTVTLKAGQRATPLYQLRVPTWFGQEAPTTPAVEVAADDDEWWMRPPVDLGPPPF
jgi:hypothetical protein